MTTVKWVFDGIGAAVLVAIIGWLLDRRRKQAGSRRSIRSGSNSVNVQSERDVTIRDIER
jgi:hypothetical protein